MTSQVIGGGRPISLVPGAHKALEMVVHLSATSGSSHSFLIHAVPSGVSGQTDAVKAVVNAT